MNPPPPILVVDDNHEDLVILKRLLTRSGVKNAIVSFEYANEAQRFLEAAIRTPDTRLVPAVIFADKRMPDMDGLELLAWVRKQSALRRLPFIILTSALKPADANRALEAGATQCFEKFPSPATIADLLSNSASRRRRAPRP